MKLFMTTTFKLECLMSACGMWHSHTWGPGRWASWGGKMMLDWFGTQSPAPYSLINIGDLSHSKLCVNLYFVKMRS